MTKPTGKPEGRPKTVGADAAFRLRLPATLKARIEDDATRQGLSVSEWLRRAAVERLASEGQK